MDKITLDRIKTLSPFLIEEAEDIYKEICEALTGRALCRFAYCTRTFKEQHDLYQQGRNGNPGPVVTNAKAGESYHNYGLAVDIVLIVDKDGNGSFETASWDLKSDFDGDGKSDWQEVVQIFKKYGWSWGGEWKFTDNPHFQKTFGYSIKDLQKYSPDSILKKHFDVKTLA
jgi:peptidoglycan L-alanyl-D-glutamate endopeptidase CwlK